MSITTKTTKAGERRYEVRLRTTAGREFSRTFRTRKDAERFEATQRADLARGLWIDPTAAEAAFDTVAADWLRCNPGKRSSSLARDETTLRVHLLPTLGARPIGSISPAMVQDLVNGWVGRLAPRTITRNYAVLRAVFTYAVDTDRIPRSPCRRIKLPPVAPVQHRLGTPEELQAVAAGLPVGSRLMVPLGAVLGLRWGEAAGLRVGDVDFLARTVSVVTQRTRGEGGRTVVVGPKWGSARTMSVPEPLLELIAAELRRRGLTAADSQATICVSDDGGPLDYPNWRQRAWLPACKAAGVPGLRFQSLRTANTTAMVALAVDVKTAQTRAGHKNAQTTLNIYARPTASADQQAAQALGAFFLGGQEPDVDGDEQPRTRAARGIEPSDVGAASADTPPDQGECGGATWNRTRDLSIISAAL